VLVGQGNLTDDRGGSAFTLLAGFDRAPRAPNGARFDASKAAFYFARPVLYKWIEATRAPEDDPRHRLIL